MLTVRASSLLIRQRLAGMTASLLLGKVQVAQRRVVDNSIL